MDDHVVAEANDLHPMYAVSGFLIMRAASMERWLYIAASSLGLVKTYTEAEDLTAGKVVARLIALADRLPQPDRSNLLAHLASAANVLELRHALVHGTLLYDPRKQLFESQRLPRGAERRQQPDPENPTWKKHRFTAQEVVDAGQAAGTVSNLFQTQLTSWSETLQMDSDV